MQKAVVRTVLHVIMAISIAATVTLTYDLLTFMQAALVDGIPHTVTLSELLFQLWFFGSNGFYPVWIPLLLIAVCAVGLGMEEPKEVRSIEETPR